MVIFPDITNYGFIEDFGLMFDLFGSILLLKGVAIRDKRAIISESSTPLGGNPQLTFSNAYQTVESLSGFMFLIIGFTIQYYANAFLQELEPPRSFVPFLIGTIFCTFIYLLIIKPISLFKGRSVVIYVFRNRILEDLGNVGANRKDFENNTWATLWGQTLKISRKSNEDNHHYALRLSDYVTKFET